MFDPNCPASCYNVDLTRNTALLSHPGLWHHGVPDDDFQWLLPSEQDPQGGWYEGGENQFKGVQEY